MGKKRKEETKIVVEDASNQNIVDTGKIKKKKKDSVKEDTPNVANDSEIVPIKKQKLKRQNNEERDSKTDDAHIAKNKIKKVKDNLQCEEATDDTKPNKESDSVTENNKPNKKKKKRKTEASSLSDQNEKPKKIIFVDDEPQEVKDDSQITKETIKRKSKKVQNDDETEINDEDIDRFCDELTEEDNVQYENWIKLIEANMHSNKKVKK